MRVQEIFDLRGTVAIIAGASSATGRYFSLGLAEAGANLVLVSHDINLLQDFIEQITPLGVDIVPVQADVTDEAAVQSMVDSTIDRFKKIDVLVNNVVAGYEEGRFDSTPMQIVRNLFEVNVFGVMHCCQRVGREMIKQGFGKIINVSSNWAVAAPRLDQAAAYCASKGAIISFSREIALDWAKHGVHVYCVAPGSFPSETSDSVFEDPERERIYLQEVPLGRHGGEIDMKGLIVFLASPASDYLIGQTILFDGGETID